MNVAVIGAGSWGTAVALLLARGGHTVRLWARNPEVVHAINTAHANERYLAGAVLPKGVKATGCLGEALEGAGALVLATPSKAVRATCQQLAAHYVQGTPLVLLSKGVEAATGKLLLAVAAEALGSLHAHRLAVLSGPNHAEEVAQNQPSATVVAARELEVAQLFQELFTAEAFRVYTSTDTTGVQLCGAAKNIIAIAAGIAAGSGHGDNTAAMLMTRGLAEISRLVAAAGGNAQTCMGLAGMGDLIVTCTSQHSRNRGFGEALAAGETLEGYEASRHMVVEGALAAQSVTALAAQLGIELPICETVRALIWEGLPLDELIPRLMQRPAKPEFY